MSDRLREYYGVAGIEGSRAGLVLAAREAVSKCVNERISIGRGRLESDNEQLLTDNRERCSWACAKSEDCPFFSPVVQT